MKSVVRFCADVVTWGLSYLIPKDRSLIVFHGSTTAHYNENSRFLFEYLLATKTLKPIWVTQDRKIYDWLCKHNKPVMRHRSFKGLWCYLRAGFVVGTGTTHPNLFKAVGKKTIKICLHHGMGPRSTNAGRDINEPKYNQRGQYVCTTSDLLKQIHQWDYFNFTSRFTATTVGKLQFILPEKKRIVMGYPRCDHLLDHKSNARLLSQKTLAKQIFADIQSDDKLILYSPTWRLSNINLSLPLLALAGFDLAAFDQFLLEQKAYFFVSIHPIVTQREDLSHVKRIRYLPQDSVQDINLLLPEISLLVSDYSSIITDFALMDRPLVFVMPDYEDFLYNRGLLEDFKQNLPGREAADFTQLLGAITSYFCDPNLDSQARRHYLVKYYDCSITNSCERLARFITGLAGV